ncbi:MAG: LamG domain-containing protein, partial [Planctomycetaceae bacterium]
RTFAEAQDWTSCAIKTLTLYFYGSVDNTGNAPLWVKLTDASNKSAKVTFGDAGEDVTALADQAWTEWNMPLDRFTGIDLTNIASITIGIGPGVAGGRLFIDDIRLYPARVTPTPAAPVLVGHWKLDNNVQDSSGNGNHGTLSGGPTYDAVGRIGAALYLDGVDDYVNCGNGASLNITDAVTLSVWVNPRDAGNAQHNDFVGKGDTSYAIKHNSTNVLQFFIYDGTWYSVNGPVLTADFNNNWHHVAGTYDGTQLKLYVDGKLINGTLRKGVIASSTYNVNIGRNSQNTDRLYNGQIDEVHIYRGALPKSEIVKLANP